MATVAPTLNNLASKAPDVKERIVRGLIERGLTPVQAIAVAANFGAESSFNPSAYNSAGGGQGAFGLGQWRGDRQRALTHLAREKNVARDDLDHQLDFTVYELHTTEKAALDAIKDVEDVNEAARIFRDKYERPGGHGYQSTNVYASQLNEQFGGFRSEAAKPLKRKSSLFDFAMGSGAEADKFGKIAEGLALSKLAKDPSSYVSTNKNAATQPLDVSFDLPPPAPSNIAGRPPLSYGGPMHNPINNIARNIDPAQLSMGENVGADLPAGPSLAPPVSLPDSGGGNAAPTSLSTSGSGPGGAPNEVTGSMGIMEKLGRMVYPDADDPEDSFKKLIGGLGVGLGQMSAGEPVDLQPYFANIAAQKQAIIDGERAERQAELDYEISSRNADTARMNAEAAAARLQFDQQKENYDITQERAPVFSVETLEGYAADPATKGFVDMMRSDNAEARKEGVQGLRQHLVDAAKARTDGDNSSGHGELFEAVANGAPPEEVANIAQRHSIPMEDISKAYNTLGKTPTADMRELEQYQNDLVNNPARARLQEKMWQHQIGVDETPREKEDRQYAMSVLDQYDKNSLTSSRILAELATMEGTTNRLIEEGVDSGAFNEAFTGIADTLRSLVGSEATAFIEEVVGTDSIGFANLTQSEKALALLVAQPLMEGGGSISDGEREAMLKMIARGNTSHETRLEIIQRMRATYVIDQIIAEQYGTQLGDDYSKARKLKSSIEQMGAAAVPELARANQAAVGIKNMNKRSLPGFERYRKMTPQQLAKQQSPILTQRQYDTFKKAIPANKAGKRLWAKLDEDGNITYMINDEIANFN